MAAKKSKTDKTKETPKPEDTPKAETAKAAKKDPKPKKTSALDAAAKVLGEAGQPMTCMEMIEAMSKKGYALVARFDVPSQRRRAADFEGTHNLGLARGHGMSASKSVAIQPQDVAHFMTRLCWRVRGSGMMCAGGVVRPATGRHGGAEEGHE